MRNISHGSLSSRSLEAIYSETWSKNKSLMRLKIIDFDADDFTISKKPFLTRALLDTECRIFGNAEEMIFSESGQNCDMSLSDREESILLLDKRTCCTKSFFSSVNDWRKDQDALK